MGNFLSSGTHEDTDWKSDARFAMESGTFCVVCGNPFDIEGDVYNIDPKEPRYQWLFDFRLLGNIEDVERHEVASANAEPVNTSETDGLFLSEEAWFQTTGSGYFGVPSDCRTTDIWLDALCYIPNHGTLFPLHKACIDTSCRVIKQHRAKRSDLSYTPPLAVLCRLLNARFRGRQIPLPNVDMANDILGLCTCSDLYGPRSVLSMTKLEWWGGKYDRFYSNPVGVPDHLASFVFDVLLSSTRNEEGSVTNFRTTCQPQGLEALPTELLDSICSYLTPQNIIALHRTSKALAIKVSLDNSFWRDSLRNGSLLPHIWDLDTRQIEQFREESNVEFSPAGWDWRTVAYLLATKQFPIVKCDPRLDNIPLGLWNRGRIWSIVEETLDDEIVRGSSNSRSDSGIHMLDEIY